MKPESAIAPGALAAMLLAARDAKAEQPASDVPDTPDSSNAERPSLKKPRARADRPRTKPLREGKPAKDGSLDRKKGSFKDDEIAHFLMRTTWSVAPAHVAQIEEMGLPAYVEWMLNFETDWELEDAAEELTPDIADMNRNQLVQWWLHIMTNTKNPYQETMAFFWHDLFATSQQGFNNQQRFWMKQQVNLWRKYGAGNLRNLLAQMTIDWAMLEWLDGIRSTAARPNENFAREFWELFTLGVDNGYTQADIVQAARAFTGYKRVRRDGRLFIDFDPSLHDEGNKTIFGKIGNWGYEDIVDITLAERPVAEYIVTRLLKYFLYEDPYEATVQELAELLRESNYELKPVLQKLFLSEIFYSDEARQALCKSPLEYVIGFVRTTNMRIPMNLLDRLLAFAGQRPTEPDSVEGWEDGKMWLSPASIVERANFIGACIGQRRYQNDAGFDIGTLLPVPGASDSKTVDHLSALFGIDLSSNERARCVAYLNTRTHQDGSESVDRWDANNKAHLDERLRGLLYILALHPTYHLR